MLQKILFQRHTEYSSFHGRILIAPIKYLNILVCFVQKRKASINRIGIKVTKAKIIKLINFLKGKIINAKNLKYCICLKHDFFGLY